MPDPSFLKVMFDTLQQLPLNSKPRQRLSEARDRRTDALAELHLRPTSRNMINAVPAWTRATHTYEACLPPPPTPPRAGAGRVDERAVA